jgi:hypothetical protein
MMMHELANFKVACRVGAEIYVFVHPHGMAWHGMGWISP